MSEEVAFQFAVLRYVHDPVTAEFLNVGLVLYSKEARYLKMLVNTRYSRLSDAFGGINGDYYRRVVSHIQNRIRWIQNDLSKPGLFDDWPTQIEVLLAQVLLPDDASLVFGGYGGGITLDLEAELERLYRRLVEWYTQPEKEERRTDQQVWQVYAQEFDRHEISLHLSPVTIETPTYHYQFEHAWKNERWHPVEPVSFDLMLASSILEKANKWIGRILNLADSDQIGTVHLLLGAPHREDLQDKYRAAKVNLLTKIPKDIKVELVEEAEAAEFSERFAQMIQKHRVYQISPE